MRGRRDINHIRIDRKELTLATTEGFTRYACDVASCGEVSFAIPDSAGADGFAIRCRIDKEGLEHELVLCSEHAHAYDAIAAVSDEAFDRFEAEGESVLSSAEDLASERAAREKAESERDSWVKRYRKLAQDFAEYKKAHPEEADA